MKNIKFLTKFFDSIKKSIKDHSGKESSSRISSYIILATIILNSLIFIGIELTNAIIVWKQGETYVIPSEHLIIFGMILSHHLALLFYKTREYKGKNELVAQSNFSEVKENVDKETGKQETKEG